MHKFPSILIKAVRKSFSYFYCVSVGHSYYVGCFAMCSAVVFLYFSLNRVVIS